MKSARRTARQQRRLNRFYAVTFGLLLSLFLGGITPLIAVGMAQGYSEEPALSSTLQQEQQARALYRQQQFSEAIALWQAIIRTYAAQSDEISRVSALSNLALSYQAMGNWESAWKTIEACLSAIADLENDPDARPVLAQVLMTEGHLYAESGEPQKALERWQQAADIYAQSDDRVGVSRAQINQAQALRELGFYARSLRQLQEIANEMEDEPPSILKSLTLRRLGDALRLSGQLSQAEDALSQSLSIAKRINNKSEIGPALLSLGRTALDQDNIQVAQQQYEEALDTANNNHNQTLAVTIQLAQLSLFVENSEWESAAVLWPIIQPRFSQLALSRESLYHQINWASNLLKISQASIISEETRLSLENVVQQLQQTVEQARTLGDVRAEAYSLGLLAQAYELSQQWKAAEQLAQRAITLSDRARATDILYRWQWQLGKIWSHSDNPARSTDKAIDAYAQAITTLSALRGDLAAADAQFSFAENVEPVYREMVALLLQTNEKASNYQENIARAQEVVDSLRVAELDNYFKEACAQVQPLDARRADSDAAIVYTVVLRDRLSIILNLPNQPSQHVAVPIPEDKVGDIVKRFRQALVIRSRRDYFVAAKQAYDLLITPIRETLDSSGVSTIVFVPDGPLQTVPLAALYDGDRFLIEDYAVGVAPSLQLTDASPWSADSSNRNQRTLIGGLTESRAEFSALPYVEKEIDSITRIVSSNNILLNQDFTQERLANRLRTKAYPIVHIATHGQFGSTPQETFLLTWDGRINVQEINQMLQANLGGREGIKLLLLSACETAISDPKAGLGLAGVAVKAGASSTLGSLWAINDEATAHFVETFYQQLVQPGTSRAEALRKTQLMLLKDPQYQHPIYWAAYVMLGSWL